MGKYYHLGSLESFPDQTILFPIELLEVKHAARKDTKFGTEMTKTEVKMYPSY